MANETKARIEPNAAVHGGMKAQWLLVTPELASEWLSRNTRNRNFVNGLADRYAMDMRSGTWLVTHQGVAITTEGVLADGQHRLQAIVDSGLPQTLLVVTGLPPAAIEVLDRGKVRSLAHALQIMGFDLHSNRAVATARVMLQGPSSSRPVITDMLLRMFMDRHREAILFAAGFSTNGYPAVLAGLVARAYYHGAPEAISRFVAAYRDEIPFEDRRREDAVARLLNRALNDDRKCLLGTRRVQAYRKAQNALHAYLDGRTLDKIYAKDDDLFPLPADE